LSEPTASSSAESAEVDRLLAATESDLAGLAELTTHEQVSRYEGIHDSLVQALTRTADTQADSREGPAPGRPGA
jgi:hypothetical protein